MYIILPVSCKSRSSSFSGGFGVDFCTTFTACKIVCCPKSQSLTLTSLLNSRPAKIIAKVLGSSKLRIAAICPLIKCAKLLNRFHYFSHKEKFCQITILRIRSCSLTEKNV